MIERTYQDLSIDISMLVRVNSIFDINTSFKFQLF